MCGILAAGPFRRRACMLNGSMAAARMLKVGLLILRLRFQLQLLILFLLLLAAGTIATIRSVVRSQASILLLGSRRRGQRVRVWKLKQAPGLAEMPHHRPRTLIDSTSLLRGIAATECIIIQRGQKGSRLHATHASFSSSSSC
jgi:hypothetical protein